MALAVGTYDNNVRRDQFGRVIPANEPGGINGPPLPAQPQKQDQFGSNGTSLQNGIIGSNPWNQPLAPAAQPAPPAATSSTSGGFVNGAGAPLPAATSPDQSILDAVNHAWDLQTQLANSAVDKRFISTTGGKGYLPSDPAAQAIRSELLAPVTAQLGAGRANDVASALQAQMARAAADKNFAAQQAQQQWENNYRTQQLGLQQQQLQQGQAQQQFENTQRQQQWELEQQRLKNQLAIDNAGLQNQISAAAKPLDAPAPAMMPSLQGVQQPVNTGSSGESFDAVMSRFGYGSGGAATGAGSGLASYAGTISGGSNAGLTPDGSWHINGQSNTATVPSNQVPHGAAGGFSTTTPAPNAGTRAVTGGINAVTKPIFGDSSAKW